MRRAVWVAVVGFGLLGCGGTESGSESDGLSAEQRCEDFAHTWCDRALGCYSEVGRLRAEQLQQEVDTCKRVGIAAVPCERAVAVGPGYDTCVSEVNAMECANWDVPASELGSVLPPSSCNGVIKLQ